jgi:hypothetical protein
MLHLEDSMFSFLQTVRLHKQPPYEEEYLPMASTYSNKFLVKEIVKEKSNKIKVSEVLGEYKNYEELISDYTRLIPLLPFVIKVSHWCGDARVIMTEKDLVENQETLKTHFNKLMSSKYSSHEPHYQHIKPYLFIEKFLGSDLKELKIHCIHGKPYLLNAIKNKTSGINPYASQPYFIMYDTNWNKLPFTRQDLKISSIDIPKPENLDQILAISEELTSGIDYVRLDLYITDNDEIYFGEYTFTPAGLGRQFTDKSVEDEMLKIYSIK